MSDHDIFARFRRAVRNHKCKIILDNGVHRHIRLASPGTSVYSFDLVTWPGHLSISGDLDDYVFRRLNDMFGFFRSDNGEIHPNFGYWSEKITAKNQHSGPEEFSEELCEAKARKSLEDWCEFFTEDERRAVFNEAEIDDLFLIPDDQREAISKLIEWQCPVTDDYPFSEFYEHRLTDYTFGYKFSCYAIQWGIKQYDLVKSGRDSDSHRRIILSGREGGL